MFFPRLTSTSTRAAIETRNVALRRQARGVSGRFDQAAGLLSSPDENERVAGVALLRSLWRGDHASGEAVEDVLSAFVRRRTGERDESQTKLPLDVAAALSALGERPEKWQARPLDLSGARLRGVEWPFARLSGAHLVGADLRGALLVGADLRGAWLRDARLDLANLDDANLCGADLRGAFGFDEAQQRGAKSDETTRWPTATQSFASLRPLKARRFDVRDGG